MFGKFALASGIVALFFAGGVAFAQVRDTDVSVSVSPEFLAPNQMARARVSTFSTPLDKAYITWAINNERMSGGIGMTEFAFNTGNRRQINLTVSIDTATGQSVIRTITLTPAEVDLLWEATDSYAPPFYRGKTLGEMEGTFKVVAIPSIVSAGERLHSANLSYNWSKDRQPQQHSSGWGRDSFTFSGSYIDAGRGNLIQVSVSDLMGRVNSGGEMFLQPSTAKLLFYEKDPILGLKMERALGDGYSVPSDGAIIAAVPYFVSPRNLASGELQWQWFLGGEEFPTPETKSEMGIRPPSGRAGGTSSVRVVLNNIRAIFSGVENEIQVSF